MKKVFLGLVAIIAMFLMTPITEAKNDVKVYMFTKNGCPACEEAFDYFEGLLEEHPGLFELVNIEVWCGVDYTATPDPTWITGNEDALDLLLKALDKFDQDKTRLATPTIVVGDYIQIGAQDLDSMYDRIENYRDSKDYKDMIQELADENSYNINDFVKDRNAKSCDIVAGSTAEAASGKYDVIVIVGIFVVLIGGFAGLIIISKK